MINLGDKNWGVKDSGLLAYKQVGSKYFNKDFDFTRASNGTYVDKNGVLQTAELYNLLPYGSDFSEWTLTNATIEDSQIGYDKTNNAYKIVANGVNNDKIRYNLSTISQQTFSVFLKKGNVNFAVLEYQGFAYFDLENGLVGSTASVESASVQDMGNGWFRCSIQVTTTANRTAQVYVAETNGSTFTTSGSYIYVQDAQVVEGTEPLDYQYTNGRVGIPRIDFSDGVGALLLEPQRSNLLLQSNSFDTSWITFNTSVTSGQSGVYGSNDAWLLQATASTSTARLQQAISLTGVHTTSIYAKAGSTDWIAIQMWSNHFAYFDVANGVVGNSGSAIDASIEAAGNGFYRCSISYNASSVGNLWVYVIDGNGSTSVTSGKNVYLQSAQLEVGSYPTSIIETTTSPVTRIADVANNCGSEQDFNSEEGVLYAEIAALANDGTSRVISLNDGSNSNRIHLFYFVGSNTIYVNYRVSGTSYAIMDAPLDNLLDFNKIAYKFSSGDFALWVNGVKVDTDGNTTMMPSGTIDRLDFDAGGGGAPFYGKVRNVKYFPEALGDTKLMTLTGGDGSLQGLFNTFQARVLADGGYIESQDCIINEIKELL